MSGHRLTRDQLSADQLIASRGRTKRASARVREAEDRIAADHLQAREDVKRLAKELRGRIEACCPSERRSTGGRYCGICSEHEWLLSEVTTS